MHEVCFRALESGATVITASRRLARVLTQEFHAHQREQGRSVWNTPDILPFGLQTGGPNAFKSRAVLAATLSPAWGIYGPPFELQERTARDGAEEYAANPVAIRSDGSQSGLFCCRFTAAVPCTRTASQSTSSTDGCGDRRYRTLRADRSP